MALRHTSSFSVSDIMGEGLGSFYCSTRGMHIGQCPCVTSQGGLASHEELTHTIGVDLTLSLLSVSEHYSIQCLTVVFSLVTPIPRFNGRSVWRPPLGLITDVWYSAQHSAFRICRTSVFYHPSLSHNYLNMQLQITSSLHLCPMTHSS